MIPSTKFASLIGSVTLAFLLAASIRPVNTAPVIRRQDAAAAPAGYISVAQSQMSEQDIYAVGIPPSTHMTEQDIYAVGNPPLPAADPASQVEQILKVAAQAALSTINTTMNAVNHYDATPSTTLASPEQVSQVGTSESVQQMTGNAAEGGLFKQAAGVSTAGQGSDTYQNVIVQQMELLGNKARRGLEEMVARQLGLGVPTPLSETGVVSAAVPEVTGAAAPVVSAVGSPAAPADTAVTGATAAVSVAPPAPSDFSSPPVPTVPSGAADTVPSLSAAVPSAPVRDAPVPTSDLATASVLTDLPMSAVPKDLPTWAVPEVPASLPPAPGPSAPAVPIPSLLPSLEAAAASATTLLPTSDAARLPLKTASAEDVTMTVTLPNKALPTSIAGLPNRKINNAAKADDDEGDWKTMTILVPAEAFGSAAGAKTPAAQPPASSASADEQVTSSTSNPASAKATPMEAPINLSSFTSMKAAVTGVVTIPLTGVIDGMTYSTMLTLTIPRFGGPASFTSAPALTTSLPVSATDNANMAAVTSAPVTKSAPASSAKPTCIACVDAAFIHPDDIPPLLKGPSTSSPASRTSSPTAPDDQGSGDDKDCQEEDTEKIDERDAVGIADSQSKPKSLLAKVWNWVAGEPLNERDWDDVYGYDYQDEVEGEWDDAQE
ncbi:hypothetical protein NDA18_001610 [Ustilago nuda]|nr:hypothetical protein NDA18_001610 [Ustilago nuda]